MVPGWTIFKYLRITMPCPLEAIKNQNFFNMKNLLIAVLATASLAMILGFGSQVKQTTQSSGKAWVIAPRFLYLKEGVSKDEARKWLENEYLPLYKQFPGFNAMLGETFKSAKWGSRDSTDKDKDFVVIYFFDSKETFDRYFTKYFPKNLSIVD